MAVYDDSLLLRDARARFFAANAGTFGADGGYDQKWVRLEFGPIPLYLPNTAGRRNAVGLHDLHHIATEYRTDLVGEAEIGAWEVGTGCRDYWHAWVLNLWAFAIGLLIAPRRTFRAFVRGLRSGTLYDSRFDESLLDQTVGALRERLRLNDVILKPSAREIAQFILWSTVSVMAIILGAAPIIAVVVIALMILL